MAEEIGWVTVKRDDLNELLDYCYEQEITDYYDQRMESGLDANSPKHIFTRIIALQNVMNDDHETPDHAMFDWFPDREMPKDLEL